MTVMMPSQTFSEFKLPARHDGRVLAASMDVVSGSIMVPMAFMVLWNLWIEAQIHMPFAVPPDVLQYLSHNTPWILSKLVNVVASLAGLLVGISWFFSGLADIVLRSRKLQRSPGALMYPAVVAHHLESGSANPLGAKSTRSRGLFSYWKALGRLTPITRQIFRELLLNALKWTAFFILLLGMFEILGLILGLIWKNFQTELTLPVSEKNLLICLVIGIILSDFLLASILFFYSTQTHGRGNLRIQISGKAQPRFLLALFEEAVRIFASGKSLITDEWRVVHEETAGTCGSLLEECRTILVPPLRKPGYACIIGSILFTLIGFYGLMHFELKGQPLETSQFLTDSGLSFVFRILFLIALLLAGRHFAHWAKRFLAVTSWKSNMFLVTVSPVNTDFREQGDENGHSPGMGALGPCWRLDDLPRPGEVPKVETYEEAAKMIVRLFWAEAITQSNYRYSERGLVCLIPSAELDELIDGIVDAPFHAHFQRVSEEWSMVKDSSREVIQRSTD